MSIAPLIQLMFISRLSVILPSRLPISRKNSPKINAEISRGTVLISVRPALMPLRSESVESAAASAVASNGLMDLDLSQSAAVSSM